MRMPAIQSTTLMVLCIVAFALGVSGCETVNKATNKVENLGVVQWVKGQSSDMRQDLKRIVRPLLEPFFQYPNHMSIKATNVRANAPFIEPRLIKALALEEDMADPIRSPIKGLPRTYANNPRRGKSELLPMFKGVIGTYTYAQEPEFVTRWMKNHQPKTSFRQALDQLDSTSPTLSRYDFYQMLQAQLPMHVQQQIPLRVLLESQQHPLATFHWQCQQTDYYHPSLIRDAQDDPVTRGEVMEWAVHLSGLDSELLKMQDDPYADEWWSPHHADPDARASLMRGWKMLTTHQQHYAIISYAYGFMDKVLSNSPPDSSDDLKHWDLGYSDPISSIEALRALAWAEEYRHGFTM